MATDGAHTRTRVVTFFFVIGTSCLLGYLRMPPTLHAMASLGLFFLGIGTVRALEILASRPGPPPTGNSSANALG